MCPAAWSTTTRTFEIVPVEGMAIATYSGVLQFSAPPKVLIMPDWVRVWCSRGHYYRSYYRRLCALV